jgi:hypothetical protein
VTAPSLEQCRAAIIELQARLKWYQVYSHILTLNVSEQCRTSAKEQADKQVSPMGTRSSPPVPTGRDA